MAVGEGYIPPSISISKEKHDVFKRVPHEKPPFTLGEIKRAIPPHCFTRSVLRSFSYVVYDFSIAFLLYYVVTNYFGLLTKPLSYLAWPIYWLVQGCVFVAISVIMHECGHQAFSDYWWLDDTIGLLLHTFQLAPYFSWKYIHNRHHSNTNSIERDELFVPKTKDNLHWLFKYSNNPPGRVLTILTMLIIGWPLYLLFHMGGRKYERFACHFNPYGPMYTDRERLQIYISDIAVLVMYYGLFRVTTTKGLVWVMCVYGNPLLVSSALRVMITYLQHTHPSLPHYDSSEWNWLRGALATVDRDYGVLNKVFHNLTDTHVVHHLFSTMPHYHAMEATKAISPILGEYYKFDQTPFYKAMWREVKECIYVEADKGDKSKGVLWYRNKL